MERSRDCRRGSAGGTLSAPRRPRTSGLKDATVVEVGDDTTDDIQNSRLRERPKKESTCALQGNASTSFVSSSRNKRKRQGCQEFQSQLRSSTVDDLDETTEDTEVGASEEDDDPPPPPIPRRPAKSRPQVKVGEDGMSTDLPAVPRKTRTAILKRPQEVFLSVLDMSQQDSSAKFKTPPPNSSTTSSSPVVSVNSGRRMKPGGSKLRRMKFPKAATQIISEQEVEVAEALFDLARMFTIRPSSPPEISRELRPDLKADCKHKMELMAVPVANWDSKLLSNNISFQTSSEIISSQTPVLQFDTSVPILPPSVMPSLNLPLTGATEIPENIVPSSLSSSPAEAPKRKRPRIRARPDEVGLPSQVRLPGNSLTVSHTCGPTPVSKLEAEPEQMLATSPLKANVSMSGSALNGSVQSAVTMPACAPLVLDGTGCNSPTTVHGNHQPEEMSVKFEVGAAKVNSRNTSTIQKNIHQLVGRNVSPAYIPACLEILAWETELATHSESTHGGPESELGKSPTQEQGIPSDGSLPVKFDIDLMAPPLMKGTLSLGVEKSPECSDNSGKHNSKDGPFREGDDQTESQKSVRGEMEQDKAMMAKLSPPERSVSRALLLERVGLPSGPHLSRAVATSNLSTSVEMPGWPVGLNPVGFYNSAAAGAGCWPTGLSHGQPASRDDSSPSRPEHPFIFQAHQPQSWKRCASHVYIAHFIDVQQQMNRHPFIQAAYQGTSSFYGAKQYNLNIPLPGADALLGNVLGGQLMSGVAGVNMIPGRERGPELGIVPVKERHLEPIPLMGNIQSKERLYGEVISWKQVAQQPHQESSSAGAKLCTGFNLPVTQNSASAASGMVIPAPVSNGGGSVGIPGPGKSSLLGPEPAAVSCFGTGGINSGVPSNNIAQTQYLQAVMHQGSFPFPLQPTGHFGSSVTGSPGYIAQQHGTFILNNPQYTTHLLLPHMQGQQQVQQSSNVSEGHASMGSQHLVGHNLLPGSPQEKSSLTLPSQVSSPPQQCPTPQPMPLLDREGDDVGSGKSTIEGNSLASHGNVYEKVSINPTIDSFPQSTSIVLGVDSLLPQDFKLMSGLGLKHIKQHQQGQLVSQQKLLPSRYHSSDPALQRSLKGIDHQSQAFSTVGMGTKTRPLVVGPGPLGLAPVAAVMVPQRHAILHSIADVVRSHSHYQQAQCHSSVAEKSQQHSLQFDQEQSHHQESVVQRATPNVSILEEGRARVDENAFSSRSGKDGVEDNTSLNNRGAGSAGLSRVEIDTTSTIQGSCPGVPSSRIIATGSSTLNIMTSESAIVISQPPVQGVGSGCQHSCSKQALPRSKLLVCSGEASLPSSIQPQLSFSDRGSSGTLLCSTGQGPSLSLSGHNLQVLRQDSLPQHSHSNLLNKDAAGLLQTSPGSAPQVVLAATTAKSHQGAPQQQQGRPQAQVCTNAGTLSRLPSVSPGGSLSTMGIPLPLLLPPVSKSAPSSASKIGPSKSNISSSHKPSSGTSGKRSTTALNVHISHIPPMLGQNSQSNFSQNNHPSQPSFQQDRVQNVSQYHLQLSSLPQPPSQTSGTQSLMSTQFHQVQLTSQGQQLHSKQILVQNQQTHQVLRNSFPLNSSFQQLQHASLSSAHPQQLTTHLMNQKSISPSSKLQHGSSSLLHQQVAMQSIPLLSSPGTSENESLSLAHHSLTFGMGCHGISSSSMSSGSDSLSLSQGSGSRSSKVMSSSETSLSTVTSQRDQGGNQSLLHVHAPKVTSTQQKSVCPKNISGLQYSQPVANSGMGGKLAEQTAAISDSGCQEQGISLHVLQSSSPLSSQIPQTSSVLQSTIGGGSILESTGLQFATNNDIEGTGTRSVCVLSGTSPGLSSSNSEQSSNVLANNVGGLSSNVHLSSDGNSFFGRSSSEVKHTSVTIQGQGGTAQSTLSKPSST